MSNKTSILITGDFCPINRINDLILDEKFEAIFNDFLPVIKDAGLAITNLECPLTSTKSPIKKTGPLLKASVESAKALSISGFKLVTLANNHIMDYGFSGLMSTINACTKNSIDYVGVGASYDEAREAYYTKLGSYTVAILNFTENEFSTTHGNFPGSNPLDLIENYRDIVKAKTKSDYVIVIVHGGHEMHNLPSPRLKTTFQFYVDAGANAIIAHHSHCYSGFEIYKGAPIFFGLGNFIFDKKDKRNSDWNYGYAVELILGDNVDYNIIPYEQCNKQVGMTLFKNTEKQEFFEKIEQLNIIIGTDELLNIEFDKYCKTVKRAYSSYLEPHSLRILQFLQSRRFFPSLISKKKKTLFLNLMRCESHRDVLIRLLESQDHLLSAE